MNPNTISVAESPCYLFDEAAIERNVARVAALQEACDCRVLMALKGFAVWRLFSYFSPVLAGVAAGSLNEVRLAADYFDGDIHVYAPAYKEEEFAAIAERAAHIVFNSESQWRRRRHHVNGKRLGIRLNPGYSEVSNPLYNPCRPRSQFGVAAANAEFLRTDKDADEISGVHIHALCEQNADALVRLAEHIHRQFGAILKKRRWINLGGGHLLADEDYDGDALSSVIRDFRRRYGLEVYLEPSGGLVSHCCHLITTVLDILPDNVVILDISASAHIPDVIEAPYRPDFVGAGGSQSSTEFPYVYHLCGATCMAGDIFGDYAFSEPLQIGGRLAVADVAAYTTVKSTMFNGIAMPSIALHCKDNRVELLRTFLYEDYRNRVS